MNKMLRACLLLLLTTVIWGFAMAFQREASQHLGAFTFNASRFTLGALVMLPFEQREKRQLHLKINKYWIFASIAVGATLFLASCLQQIGVKEAGAGKTGFLTSLYVVLVPVLGAFFGKRTTKFTWIALAMAVPALYLLCMGENERFVFSSQDGLLLLSALMWAVQILLTDYFVRSVPAVTLCTVQFAACAALNWALAFCIEDVQWANIQAALIPILYCGVFSTAVGYTLQTIGQKDCPPALSALILSLESVFCVLAGAVMLGERMGARSYLGCGLMLVAVLTAQLGAIYVMAKEKRNALRDR